MIAHRNLSVAVPWSLSHYIPLNGFHPLYRALFDQAPSNIEFHAWDNVKLYERFGRDIEIRDAILQAAHEENSRVKKLDARSLSKAYQEFFWPPNQVLTNALSGDIEFHHTAPFPSLKRPFVFHCEAFSPVFLPFAQQGSGEFKNHEELRRHYRSVLSSPLCLGIFSHIPETLTSLSKFFSCEEIDRRLFNSRIGLSAEAIANSGPSEKTLPSRPIFLFVNSANQNPANFFRRGGHIVLRFWQKFIANGRNGRLMLRCTKPEDDILLEHGVDISFLNAETGRSILWAEEYLGNLEMNALMANAHFFLLPSLSLHSVSIMQAMVLGTIPVVTDTVGTSVYLEDEAHGIVLRGVRDAIWHADPNTGVLVDRYSQAPTLDDSLVSQLTRRIFSLLDAGGAYQQMRGRMVTHAQRKFSGGDFSQRFWNAVLELHEKYERSASVHGFMQNIPVAALRDCTIQKDGWARVFEGATQPRRSIYTGRSIVWELGGAFVHAYGNPSMTLNDWSVLARYFSPDAPELALAATLEDLGGKYLSFGIEHNPRANRKLIGLISRALLPYPELHSVAASLLKRIRRYRNFLAYKLGKSNMEPDTELVHHAVFGYNVIRYFHKFYAIPQSEGAFIPEKVKESGYSSCFYGNSADEVLRKITHSVKRKNNNADPEAQ